MLEERTPVLVQCLSSLANDVVFMQQVSSRQSPAPNREHAHMQVSSSDHCERAILSTCSQRVRMMKSVSFTTSKAQKAGVFQAPQPLCEEDSLVADAAVLRLPGILLLPGIMFPF